MSIPISIRIGDRDYQAELNNSSTAKAIVAALPLECPVHRWGDEIYFSISVQHEESDDARTEMQQGELAYWSPGQAFCIFFGPTPASYANEPRAASPVNPVGRWVDDWADLLQVRDGETLRISLLTP